MGIRVTYFLLRILAKELSILDIKIRKIFFQNKKMYIKQIMGQPTSSNMDKKPHFKSHQIHHVDVTAQLSCLRVAPSRTSPISTIHSQGYTFMEFAVHSHPTRHDFISARQAGTSHLWIYPAVTDPSIKPISDVGYGQHPDPPCLRKYYSQD